MRDVFLHQAREESQHAILDELERVRADATLTAQQRKAAERDLISLVAAVHRILIGQAGADAEYYSANCGQTRPPERSANMRQRVSAAVAARSVAKA
ncbi:MAG: hypothetical protein KDI45_05320 [Candidatus Accumulibacter sp.]|nr:hypothetical protein [Accumulibacter sp.]